MGEDELQRLAEDISRLESIVSHLKALVAAPSGLDLAANEDGPRYATYARAICEARGRLHRFLPGDYYTDPAFDMLLDLFVASESGQKRSFKVSALASRVPPATAARYVEMMVRDGTIVRESDPRDGRRTLLSLPPAMIERLRDWLDSLASTPLHR